MDDEGNDPSDGQAPPPSSTPPSGFGPPPPSATPPSFEPPRFPAPSSGTPPTFEPAPGFGSQPGPFGAPGTAPTGAMAPPAPPHPYGPPVPPVPPGWKRLIAPTEPVEGPRPIPTLTSMIAVGGGLLAATGLFALLDELDGYAQRTTGLVLSLLFVALGVAISVLNRSSRAAAGGVALSILGVIPFTAYVFANANLFDLFSGGPTDGDPWEGVRWTVTLMLLTAAALWLVGYLFVPTRRFGALLGAALLALWLIPIFNLQLSAIEDTFSPFGTISTFEPVPTDPGFDSGFDDPSLDDFDSQFGDDVAFEEPQVSDPSTKIGMASLAIGALYLVFAAWRDRKGDARMATAALVPAVIVLLTANSSLTGHIGWVGSGLLAIVVGGAVLAVGLQGERRASSWIGMVLAIVGLGSLVFEGLGESPRAIGVILTVLGVGLALGAGRADSRRTRPEPAPGHDAPPAGPEPGAPDPLPAPWSQTF